MKRTQTPLSLKRNVKFKKYFWLVFQNPQKKEKMVQLMSLRRVHDHYEVDYSVELEDVDPNVVGYHDLHVVHVSDTQHVYDYVCRAYERGYRVQEITGLHNGVYLCQHPYIQNP